ncbi:proline--tRNA ligase [Methyloradius palustris]|uniref:Proline--tRNA ligase n=1 Tax=Methyloradius palustris TaxID=2778876 RepID=A0A8D5JKP4_9PROT|nr:proline--tRNA ligase [Methyloradius palustris]BCM24115.1 proline--tRNA ligase [Methyloradius palustris]
MRASQFFLNTQKEAPQEAELISHRLMLRAGLIKRLGSGLYTWMPLGLRVLRKVEAIVREEMNNAGALELLMPAVQPKELWEETGRWAVFGPQMLKIKDRHDRDFCFGPTHEEVITDLVRREIKSYKQLPLNFYQIQTKFRDEIRPRFGVMRAREFMMKDAYSFHTDLASLEQTYEAMYQAYSNVFTRLGLKFRAVRADTGAIGGDGSHEFHVLADSGEDALAYCPTSDYAANVELAEGLPPIEPRQAPSMEMVKIATPHVKTISEISEFFGISKSKVVKSIAVMRKQQPSTNPELEQFCLVLIRGDHELNEIKLEKAIGSFRFANEAEIERHINSSSGYIGPVNLHPSVAVISDYSVKNMSDFVCGANELGQHLKGVNFSRDLSEPAMIEDIRNVVEGDPSPDGKGTLTLCRGIEVGHIFQLRTKYAQAMDATYLDENGKKQVLEMGCYGIGVSRIVGAAIEQGNDERGIIFPASMAPFQVAIAPIGWEKSEEVKTAALNLYEALQAAGVDVLLDDRGERPGVMFADMELVGIPHRVVIGDRGLKEGNVEYQGRTDASAQTVALKDIVSKLQTLL